MGSVHCAFTSVDLEFEFSFHKSRYAVEYPLTCLFRLYVDVAVVCVTAVGVASFLKFFVQVIEYDVGQQWRQRASLRCAFVAALDQSVFHDSGLKIASDE